MSTETARTYIPFQNWKEKSKQTEYTESTPLLSPDGTLLAKGWARHNVFEYDRSRVKSRLISRKEWDFYQISDGKCMLQLNFANLRLACYVSGKFVDLRSGEVIASVPAVAGEAVELPGFLHGLLRIRNRFLLGR